MDNLELGDRRYRAETEDFIAAAGGSGGVILGRGGQVILRGRAGVLHVLLGGPREARIRQGMEIEGVDRKTAERRQQANDRARLTGPAQPDSSATRRHSGPSRTSA